VNLVVKLGGHTLDTLAPTSPVLVDLARDVAQLRSEGHDVAIVHGGGPQIGALLASVGIASRFHEGLRVTDARTMDYVAMALGHVNVAIVAAMNQAGLRAVGLSGADATMLVAMSLGEPWDRAGTAVKVDVEIVRASWREGYTPVVSSLAVDDDGERLNCNADTVAGALCAALEPCTLVLLSDIDQLRGDVDDAGSALATVTASQVRELLQSGAARDGMVPKMNAALDALDAGAERVLMANGTRAHALSEALGGAIPTTEVLR